VADNTVWNGAWTGVGAGAAETGEQARERNRIGGQERNKALT
jgi:hypothetical protein